MSDTLLRINNLSKAEAQAEFQRCCGATRWAEAMTENRPYATQEAMETQGESLWSSLTEADWREAFAHHPKIGDLDNLRAKFATTRDWAGNEQAGTAKANDETLHALARDNAAYLDRFGYIFIVCATGKSAREMLSILRARLSNPPEKELGIAAEEQKKITRLRLRKL